VSQRRPEKGKLSLGFILLGLLVDDDDDDDEWVVAEKAMGMKNRIKGRSFDRMIRKQKHSQKDHTNKHPKNHFVKKTGKTPKTPAFKKSQPWWGGGGGT
jgi:hypothetical protein